LRANPSVVVIVAAKSLFVEALDLLECAARWGVAARCLFWKDVLFDPLGEQLFRHQVDCPIEEDEKIGSFQLS
jgi:hypothetical protein